MTEISPVWIVALLGAFAIAVGIAWSPKGSSLATAPAWRVNPTPPPVVAPVSPSPATIPMPTKIDATPSRPTNREDYVADDPADLILLAATKLSKRGQADLAAKALALSQEARGPKEPTA